MGCCKSSPDINISSFHPTNLTSANSSLTRTEMIYLKKFLSGIPHPCQQPIINLPARQLLKIYQYHEMALYHGLKKEWSLVISYEHRAIKELQILLPTDKDHYIFFNLYSILSAAFLALGELEAAIEGIHIALAILLKHTPMDYKTISNHYYYLATAYRNSHNWKATRQFLIKAIETAQFMNDLDQEYIRMLETELQMTKQRIAEDVPNNFTCFEEKPKLGESDQDFHRRITAKIITANAKHGTLHFNKDEFERLPDKQTELQVTDEILKDVLIHLEKYIIVNRMSGTDAIPASLQFIAAQFKNVQMKTSPLSAAVIEAALTMIINRLNNENTTTDELYLALKQAPVSFSYTHNSLLYAEGVRVFEMRTKECQSD